MKVNVIGAGLAGCEAAYALATRGVKIDLYEMKPLRRSPAHHIDGFAELVCSNSLKAARIDSAAGLLKEEMRQLGSISMIAAEKSSVAAGGALAVDRDTFSKIITDEIKNHPNITVHYEEVGEINPDEITIICSGPLTDGPLAETIKQLTDSDNLSFFDAAAPIVTAESIDMSRAFCASRYDKGGDDYINCPMNKSEYEAFYEALMGAERAPQKDFDVNGRVYEGCMPIEIMAQRGADTMRFGPLKPVGLRDPSTGHRPWANLQLRRENKEGTLFNLVGFQTNLKFAEQKRVFSMIPALANAEFVRYGVMHRNSFINSPKLLNKDQSLKKYPNVYFAGQITGVEGYMESASSGILAGINVYLRLKGEKSLSLPNYTMLGALNGYITDESVKDFQPMGANFGVLPPIEPHIRDKKERYSALSNRSLLWYNNLMIK
ncbi:MAG: methylenetetrahydrofolate--tRNA-(uracil(54)-C(5))-methyltransferase (FADH(2)-oxidizing) TrmFO [Clostridia bacterium]|nr:methylenetetrahydrofolate--tRNA-(uracil(54)-C(5))-methyltransferase (FADH(2)-oxidizing) TrmFO [Clostridia bacterium]MBQ9958693.1 methylenetetrahydrofolate--tRNA-(uracil(54)-C(5))-methyltransferase (FADH(2)-oxidizing) TrmFO [Clostridia bacterium]